MKTAGILSATLAATAFFATSVLADADPIVIKGSKFFYKTSGQQFYIKGVAYQQEYSANGTQKGVETTDTNYKDPLADGSQCKRDIPYLKKLGTNVIRTYAVDPTVNHDDCMSQLAAAGIYVISDLSAPGASINRNEPSWDETLYNRYTAVIDNLQKYNNVLGFFAGNEVSNSPNNTNASAFVKAAVRDMKAYIKNSGYRTIGVGYATNDDADIRVNLADYFDCGDADQAIDFWGYNIYSWCGDSSFQQSGYDVRTKEFSTYNVPVFFAEYGCNEVTPRTFTEVQALYGNQMNNIWSGGIVYMYFQEANNYGLVSVSGNSVKTLADFNALSSQIAQVTVSGVQANAYSPTNTAAAACPSVGNDWKASSKLPPSPNRDLCQCMYNALSCVPNNVAADSMGDLFGYVCGLNDGSCNGILADAQKGNYGAYAGCNSTEKLGWVLNTYYSNQRKQNNPNACQFSGSATLKAAVTPTGQCSVMIAQAGSGGTGSVAAGGSSGSGKKSSTGNAAPVYMPHNVYIGYLQIGAYLFTAFISGVGMIML